MKSWLLEHQQLLTKQLQQQQLPHALLFVGTASSGKSDLAHWLTELLACQQPQINADQTILLPCQQCKQCKLMHSATYPDHLTIKPDGRSISIDEIRSSNHFFEKTAQIGRYKSLVISDVNKMTVSAANALLKTLEEPTANSILILLSDDVETLLPTIISRCRLYTLRPPIGEKLLNELGASGKHVFANLTHLPELSDPVTAEVFIEFEQVFIDYLMRGVERAKLLKLLQESQYSLRWLEKIITMLLRQRQGWSTTQNKLYSKAMITHNEEQLWQLNQKYQACSKKIKSLAQLNSQFEFEKFLSDIKTISNSH